MVGYKFTAVVPEKFKSDAVRLEMLNGLRRIGTQITQDMRKPTETWEHHVAFERKPSLAGGIASIEVYTEDAIYGILDKGVTPRTIVPKKGRALKFPGTFSAKTAPGTLHANSGSRGGDEIYSRIVRNWSIESRDFIGSVTNIWLDQGRFEDSLEELFDTIASKTGYII